MTLSHSTITVKDTIERWGSSPMHKLIRGNGLKLHQGNFRLGIKRNFLLKELCSIGIGCPGKWFSHHL